MPPAAGITGCLFFCHGARDPDWRKPFEAIVTQFEHQRPGIPTALAFLELMSPRFDEAAARLIELGAGHVHVVPLFLAPGSHTRRDLPDLIAQAQLRWPEVSFTTSAPLTEDPVIRQAILVSATAALATTLDALQPPQ